MKGKKIILAFICVMLLLMGCTYITDDSLAGTSSVDDMGKGTEIVEENADILSEETEEAEELTPDEHVHEQNDAYKLFYGTWEVTSIVSEHLRLGGGMRVVRIYWGCRLHIFQKDMNLEEL